jgi:hypothetical protein
MLASPFLRVAVLCFAFAAAAQINLDETGDNDSLENIVGALKSQASSDTYMEQIEDAQNEELLQELIRNKNLMNEGLMQLTPSHMRAILAGHRAVLQQVKGMATTSKVKKAPSMKSCREDADAAKKYIEDSVKDQNEELKKLGDGSKCPDAAKDDVDKAKKKLDEVTKRHTPAKKDLQKAQDAPVDIGSIPFNKLKPGHCAIFHSSSSYKNAVAALKKANATFAPLIHEHAAADAAYKKALADAKDATHTCLCKIQKAHKDTEKTTKDTAEEWKKAHYADCAMDGTPQGQCVVPPVPTITVLGNVDSTVKAAKCP